MREGLRAWGKEAGTSGGRPEHFRHGIHAVRHARAAGGNIVELEHGGREGVRHDGDLNRRGRRVGREQHPAQSRPSAALAAAATPCMVMLLGVTLVVSST